MCDVYAMRCAMRGAGLYPCSCFAILICRHVASTYRRRGLSSVRADE